MFDFDDNPPQYPLEVRSILPPINEAARTNYNWMEKYIPYDPGAENNVHWFLRFK